MSRRKRLIGVLLALCLGLGWVGSASAAEWHSAQPVTTPLGVPTPFGPVGDIEFWAPNRGLLITGGTASSPAGLYAYDGSGWYLYSTVCGGSKGRIAWAGPDDFWTISDQRRSVNQQVVERRSLCHFENGKVVASYAEPPEQPTSYEAMNAAACIGPADCWFGGDRLPGTLNSGAFHLHWNGSSVSPRPSLTAAEPAVEDPLGEVGHMVAFGGAFFESVHLEAGDVPPTGLGEPSFIHRVESAGFPPFVPLKTVSPLSYGAQPEQQNLEAFHFATDGSRLWGIAGEATRETSTPVVAVRLGPGGFAQVPLEDPGATLGPENHVLGAAAEPGGPIWVSYAPVRTDVKPAPARLAPIGESGQVGEPVFLPRPGEGLSGKGQAGPIACPAVEECWMATSTGWLFELGGPPPTVDTDPAMHVLITFRPPDNGEVQSPSEEIPVDDSGAEPKREAAEPLPIREAIPHLPHAKPLVSKVHQKVIHRTVLQLSFLLHARAHVQLLAKRGKKVVAKTPAQVLAPGPHKLRLRLDPKQWPTGLDFKVHQAEKGSQ